MEKFFELSEEVMDSLTDENMALIVGGTAASEDTVNNGTGCGCPIDNKHFCGWKVRIFYK